MSSWLPFSLPSSIQKRFLSYALSRIGVFDEASLDLDKLNLTWGRQNVIELKDVALDAAAISAKANLPSSLQIASGKVTLLKLMVPADIHKSGIVIDAVGVGISVRYEQEDTSKSEDPTQYSPEQSLSNRRTTRRTSSPLASRRDRASKYDEDGIPTVQDLARSFLMEEPLAERQQLEASVAAHTASLEDSMSSESSQGTEPGTGAALGVPAFLATFLTGILDRIVVNVHDVKVTIETSFSGAASAPVTLDFLLNVPSVQVRSLPRPAGSDQPPLSPIRRITISRLSLGVLEDLTVPDLTASATQQSMSSSNYTEQGPASTLLERPTVTLPPSLIQSRQSIASAQDGLSPISDQTADTDRFADAHDDHYAQNVADSQYGIHAGDDNISWGSRQADGAYLQQNLWQSVADEDDLPDSLLLGDDDPADTQRQATALPAPQMASSGLTPWPAFEPSTMSASQYTSSEADHSMVSADEHVQEESIDGLPEPLTVSHNNVPDEEHSDPLAQSRIFSHAEAESMYMSAMTEDHDRQESQQDHAMPGAWGEESQSVPIWQATKPVVVETEAKSETATPRAHTPEPETLPQQNVRTFLEISGIELSLTLGDISDVPTKSSEVQGFGMRSMAYSTTSLARSLPKHESSLSALSASSNVSDASTTHNNQTHALSMTVSSLRLHFDIATVKTLAQMSTMLRSQEKPKAQKPSTTPTSSSFELHLSVKIREVDLALFDHIGLDNSQSSATSVVLLRLGMQDAAVSHNPGSVSIHVTKVAFHILQTQILSFVGDQLEHTKSRRRDLEIVYSSSKTDLKQQVVPELSISGQVLQVNLDLVALMQLLEHLGGLSMLLESSATIFGNHTPPGPAIKRQSGVRFQDETAVDAVSTTKANIRLAGAVVAIQSQSCAFVLRTSSVKAVQREYGFSLSTARIEAEDNLSSSTGNRLTVDNLRLDFYNSPGDKDLERLLSLLTPSNDKYDNDDDILLDTLLRQRRKGACLRLTVDAVAANITDVNALARLESLSGDISQLSVVTKYLPEDDRPGVLSIIRLKDFSVALPTTPSFGSVHVGFKELQCAHVGLPLLVAAAISDIQVEKDDGTVLVHQLLPYSGAENLPMIMTRMLGDEVEPLVKIKLYNICVEYSVPILLGLLGEDAVLDTEHIVTDLTNSVVDLATSTLIRDNTSTSKPAGKKTKLDLLIHSSALGLTPVDMPSKALFILTDARLSLSVPPSETIAVRFELRRAAMFITDDISRDVQDALISRGSTNTATDPRVSANLARQGYASILSIMSASIRVLVMQATNDRAATTEVDIGTQLMLMETCADSTQTLFATLGALAPPGKPSAQPQYLQEPVTLEDMISSFTGEAVTAPQPSQDTLFDIDDDLTSELNLAMETSQMNMAANDGLLMQSEMSESLYGPVSGLMDGFDDELADDDRPDAEAAESLLEEDPFVMTVTPDDLPFSDPTLMKDLRDQLAHPSPQAPVQLELLQVEHLGYDALGPEVRVLGDRGRFAAPAATPLPAADPTQHCPVKVRLRDVHFIWNLHDGYDWQKTRQGITSAVEKVEQRAEERLANRRHSRNMSDDDESVIGDFLFNSIYIGVPSTQEAQDIRRQINRHIDDLVSETESVPVSGISRPTAYSVSGMPTTRARRRLKLERSRSHKIAFELKGLSADFLLFAPDSPEVQSSVDVRVKTFEIFDNVPTSTWKKFLTLLHTEGGREVAKPMVHLKLLNVRTLQDYAATEIIVKVSLLPLRLHVDQDALDFITRFFEFKDDSKIASVEPSDQPFLQRVEVDTVDLQLDYKPKKVDYAGIRSGHTTEFMNFIVLDAANIRLKHAIVYGIKGFEPLHKTLNDVWMPDVRRNQLPTVLAGLAPVRSLVNITSGVRDVVAIPVREYQKDGRLVRSIQKGAYQFGKVTASELARFGAKVALGTQTILSGAEELLAPATGRPSPSHRVSSDYGWHEVEEDDGDREKRAISAYADQPLGVLAGLKSARRYLEHDLLTAKDALIAVQGEVMNSTSPGAAAVAVARHAPTVILRPVIGATRAVGTTLLGVGNQIDKDNIRKMEDKYKRR